MAISKKIKVPPLSPEQTHAMIYDIMGDSQRKVFEEKSDIDFSMQLGEVARFRVNVFRQNRGIGAVFRKIPTKILTLDQLNMPQILKDLSGLRRALFSLPVRQAPVNKATPLAGMIDSSTRSLKGIFLRWRIRSSSYADPRNVLLIKEKLGPIHRHSITHVKAALREIPMLFS